MTEKHPSVSIVIPSYNGKQYLKTLLPSLEKIDYPRNQWEIIIVDDCSDDQTGSYLNDNWSHFVKSIKNEKNKGFAGTCNAGAYYSHSDWIIFLNNDTRVDPGFIKGFIEVMDPENKIVAGAGKILDWDGQKIDFVKGTQNIFGKGFNMYSGIAYQKKEWNTPYRLPFACGGSMIVKRDIFLEIGGFDEDYFIIFEDVDLGWRLSLAGYKTFFCPRSITYHRLHCYLNTINLEKKVFLHERNAFITIFKNYDDEHYKKIIPFALLLLGSISHANTLQAKTLSAVDFYTASSEKCSAFDRFRHFIKQSFHPRFDYYTEMTRTGYGSLRVFPYLLEEWPNIWDKRQKVQAIRKVGDEEIIPLFESHFTPWVYTKNYLGFWDYKKFQEFFEKCSFLM